MNIIPDKVPTHIVLPKWIWEQAKDKEELQRLILEYINKRYPQYKVKSVHNGMAICYRE
jgi:hypothetical protein